MHSAQVLITVGVVARNNTVQATSRGPRPAAFSQRQWPVAAVLAVCAAVIVVASSGGQSPHARGQSVVLAFVACVPIAALRRRPIPVFAAVTAANALSFAMAARSAPLPFGVMLGLASYLLASRLPRRVSIPAAVASAAALSAALGYALLTVRGVQVAGEAVEGFLSLAAAWFIGDSVAARRRYMAGLAEQAERQRAAEAERARQQVREERVRIARELHDVVAHTLAVITVQAGVGRRLMARRPGEAGAALESIEAIGRTAQEELRVVLGLLRDEETGTAALAPAPRLVDVKELVETVRASGTPVDLRMSGMDRPLSAALELSLYRVVQEALTNVVKHAPGARVAVDLAVTDREIRLDVIDDGGGAARPALGAQRQPGPGPASGDLRQPGPGTGPGSGDLRQPSPGPGTGPASGDLRQPSGPAPAPGTGRGTLPHPPGPAPPPPTPSPTTLAPPPDTGSSGCASGSPRSAAGWWPSRWPAAASGSPPRSR
jgi:signal transduction histidine kinase